MVTKVVPAFDKSGEKKVSKTDKAKLAYLPDALQREAMAAAGLYPERDREFQLRVLFDSSISSVTATYYLSERSAEAKRQPEPRMGGAIISSWLQVGDRVVIGSVGSEVFAYKLTLAVSTDRILEEVVRSASDKTVLEQAKRAVGKPNRRVIQRNDFVRNPYVVAAAVIRSAGRCEMPGCDCRLFQRDDDKPYLEVHHIIPLAEDGDDTLKNAAALCPACHRELHFGKGRLSLRQKLLAHIYNMGP